MELDAARRGSGRAPPRSLPSSSSSRWRGRGGRGRSRGGASARSRRCSPRRGARRPGRGRASRSPRRGRRRRGRRPRSRRRSGGASASARSVIESSRRAARRRTNATTPFRTDAATETRRPSRRSVSGCRLTSRSTAVDGDRGRGREDRHSLETAREVLGLRVPEGVLGVAGRLRHRERPERHERREEIHERLDGVREEADRARQLPRGELERDRHEGCRRSTGRAKFDAERSLMRARRLRPPPPRVKRTAVLRHGLARAPATLLRARSRLRGPGRRPSRTCRCRARPGEVLVRVSAPRSPADQVPATAVPQVSAAPTRTRTSPGPHAGTGTSRRVGAPGPSQTSARTVPA